MSQGPCPERTETGCICASIAFLCPAAALEVSLSRAYVLGMSNSVNANTSGRDIAGSAAALQERAEDVAARLALIANARRLLILCELAKGERSVGALQRAVGLGQSALSQHLARLREAGMVDTRREGQTIHYRLCDPDLEILMDALYKAFCRDG